MLRTIIITSIILFCTKVSAQLKFSEAEVKVFSNHFWRGHKLGNGLAVEPSVSFISGKFGLTFWAAFTPNNTYSEIDIIPSWEFEKFTFTLFNYYNPVVGEKNNYLNFKENESRHSVELAVDNYNISGEKFKWMIGTFVFGDKNIVTNKAYFSSYIEIKYPLNIFAKISAEPVLGITPFKGYYAEKLAIVNAGIAFKRDLDFKLPVKFPIELSIISNPYKKDSFIVLSVGVSI